MSRIVITIETDNAWFRDEDEELDIYAAQETLREVVERLPLYGRPGTHGVRDGNGNTVGEIKIREDA